MAMSKRILLFILFTGFVFCAGAQLPVYSAGSIPDSLIKNADAVIREQSVLFTVKDINSARYQVHKIVTVLNEVGKDELFFNEFSYKFRLLDDAEIKVYNQLGEKIKSYSKREMVSLNYGEGLVPEGKVTYFEVSAPSYPITVEINYTVKYKGILSYPDLIFQKPYLSIQHQTYDVEVPVDLGLRYKILNCSYNPAIKQQGQTSYYHWEFNNMPAWKPEKYCGSRENYYPMALLAPNKFQLDEYEGDMTDWKNFGKWINGLYIKTSELDEGKKQFFQDMVKDAKTDKEKAAILYKYLQKNMRYVSIQLGIGGVRPFPASFVEEKKYGDCKALSNFLKTALNAVGVKSNIVIIEGGTKPIPVQEDFPANYFNHVILCMPQPTDTVWLECTSRTLPFGYLGPFTENRKAMLVTDEGGVLVNTPVSKMSDNREMIHTIVSVNEDGSAAAETGIACTGDFRDDMIGYVHEMKDDEKRKYFISEYEWKQPDMLNITSSSKDENPYRCSAKMEYSKVYSFKAGSKIFLDGRLYNIFDEEIPETEKRKHDYHFSMPYERTDTTEYKLPAGFTAEDLPKPVYAVYPFASFISSCKYDVATGTITTITRLQITQRVIKAHDYTKLLEFKKAVMGSLNEKIVVKKG